MIINPIIGKTYFVEGLNTRGKRVVVKAELVEIRTPDQYGRDCVTRSGGVKVIGSLSDLFETAEEVKFLISK